MDQDLCLAEDLPSEQEVQQAADRDDLADGLMNGGDHEFELAVASCTSALDQGEESSWRSKVQHVLQLQGLLLFMEDEMAHVRRDRLRRWKQELQEIDDRYWLKRELLRRQCLLRRAERDEWSSEERRLLTRHHSHSWAMGVGLASLVKPPRRVWATQRSSAWWDRCLLPSFPDSEFQRHFHIGKQTFHNICSRIGDVVAKEETPLRMPVPRETRVAVCLWRLASGECLRLSGKRFGIAVATVHKIMVEVVKAIANILMPPCLQWPATLEKQREISSTFEEMTGIPGIIGVLQTTHIIIAAPKSNLTQYHNKCLAEALKKKEAYSITMQAVVDHTGRFLDVCIGLPGGLTNERVLEQSSLSTKAKEGALQGMYLVGDSSLNPREWLLTPYPRPMDGGEMPWEHAEFNERLAPALAVGQAAMARLRGRWRFFNTKVLMEVNELPAVLAACCVLHNLCEEMDELLPARDHVEWPNYEPMGERETPGHEGLAMRDTVLATVVAGGPWTLAQGGEWRLDQPGQG